MSAGRAAKPDWARKRDACASVTAVGGGGLGAGVAGGGLGVGPGPAPGVAGNEAAGLPPPPPHPASSAAPSTEDVIAGMPWFGLSPGRLDGREDASSTPASVGDSTGESRTSLMFFPCVGSVDTNGGLRLAHCMECAAAETVLSLALLAFPECFRTTGDRHSHRQFVDGPRRFFRLRHRMANPHSAASPQRAKTSRVDRRTPTRRPRAPVSGKVFRFTFASLPVVDAGTSQIRSAVEQLTSRRSASAGYRVQASSTTSAIDADAPQVADMQPLVG